MEGENAQVLIVDDQELNRTLFETLLSEDGYRTRSVASGQAALKAVEAELPDLILLDLVMPGMGGIDVIQSLKAQEKSRAIPIVVRRGRRISSPSRWRDPSFAHGFATS